MVKNKKGWIRIVEAFLAAILILGAIVIFINKENEKENSEKNFVKEIQTVVLKEIADNEELRNLALEKNVTLIKDKIKGDIPENYNFEMKICNLTEKYCMYEGEYPKKDVYVEDRIISGNLSLYSPVKVRLFLWRKE